MNERPAFESRRVRTQPFTVTRVPVGTFPFNNEPTSTWGLSVTRRGRLRPPHGLSLDLPNEDWNDLPRLSEESRRLRGHARARPAIRPSANPRRGKSGGSDLKHLRVHRQGETGIDRHDSRDGRIEENGQVSAAGRPPGHGWGATRGGARGEA